jgi:hypothetical protein
MSGRLLWRLARCRWILAAVITMAATVGQTAAQASSQLREKLEELSKEVLKVTQQQPVKVGEFARGPGVDAANASVGIEETLRGALERVSPGSVRKEAKFTLQGRYSFVSKTSAGELAFKVIKLTVEIRDENDEGLLQVPLESVLDGSSTIAELLQVSGSIPAEGTKEVRNKKIDELAKGAREVVVGSQQTQVKGSAASPYGVEILVKPLTHTGPAEPRRAEIRDGLAYVDIRQNELYEIRLHNPTEHEVAASITVDGVDVFHFSEERNAKKEPAYTHFICAPKSAQTVVGWYRRLKPPDNYSSFLVTAIGKGAISQSGLATRGNVGVIHVQFSNCRPLAAGVRPRSGSETGFGPPRSVEQKAVSYEIDPPHEFVTVRYSR